MQPSSEEKLSRYRLRGRFIGRVRREIKTAFAEARKRGISQADIARKLGRDPALLSRQINGSANLTLVTIGDLAWALNLYPRFGLFSAKDLAGAGSNWVSLFDQRHQIQTFTDSSESFADSEAKNVKFVLEDA